MCIGFYVGIGIIALGYICKSENTGWYINSWFNILGSWQAVFQNRHMYHYNPYQQCMGFLISPQPHKYLLLSVLLIIAISMWQSWAFLKWLIWKEYDCCWTVKLCFLTLFYTLPMFNSQKHISSHFKGLIFKNIHLFSSEEAMFTVKFRNPL